MTKYFYAYFFYVAPLPYNLLVAIGHSLVTIHYQGSDSSIIRTNYSENTLAIDFNYE